MAFKIFCNINMEIDFFQKKKKKFLCYNLLVAHRGNDK